jgi:hypothetical protein
MQASADSNKTCNAFGTLAHEHQRFNITQLIFQLIDVSVTNFQMILTVDSSQLKQELVDFSSSNAFSIANLDSVSEEVEQVSLIQRFTSSTIYSKSFELTDVSVPNKNKMCSASQLAAKLLHHESSCASRLAVLAQCLKLHKTSCIFHLVARAKCHNKSNAFAFRFIVRFIQKSFQS